jgi:hypothetical protein
MLSFSFDYKMGALFQIFNQGDQTDSFDKKQKRLFSPNDLARVLMANPQGMFSLKKILKI